MEIGTTAAGCRVGFFGGSEGAACRGALGSNEMRGVRERRKAEHMGRRDGVLPRWDPSRMPDS